jgi:hypothetical protein
LGGNDRRQRGDPLRVGEYPPSGRRHRHRQIEQFADSTMYNVLFSGPP